MIAQQRSDGPYNNHRKKESDYASKTMDESVSEIVVFSDGQEVDVER